MATVQYFNSRMTADEIKAEYRNLAKRFHPDLNPATRDECTKIMSEINAQYERAVKTAYREESGDKYSRQTEDAMVNLASIISQIVTMVGIEIEVCGSWIWIGGNSFPVKDELKGIGFKWSSSKKRWYYAEDLRKGAKGFYDMERIRAKHGSMHIDSAKPKAQIG